MSSSFFPLSSINPSVHNLSLRVLALFFSQIWKSTNLWNDGGRPQDHGMSNLFIFFFCNSHEEIETFCLLSYHIVLGIHFAQLLLERGGEAMWGMKRKQDGGWTGGCVWAHDEAIGLSVCVRVCEWLASGNEWERSMWSWDYVIVHPWIHDEYYETHQRVVKYCYLYQILSNITFLEHQSYTVHTDRKERVCKEKHECVKIKLNWTEMLHNMRCL